MGRKASNSNILAETKEPAKTPSKRAKRASKRTENVIPNYNAVRFNGAEYDKELSTHWIYTVLSPLF